MYLIKRIHFLIGKPMKPTFTKEQLKKRLTSEQYRVTQ